MAGAIVHEEVNGTKFRWTAKSEAAALALANGKKWKEVTAEVDIGTTTLARWVKVPEFQARIDEHLEAMTHEARRIYQRNATVAAAKVVDLICYGLPGHSTQLAAAKDVLDRLGFKAPDKHEHTGPNGEALPPTNIAIQVNTIDYRAHAAILAPRPVLDSPAPGQDEGLEHGETLG